MTCPFDLLGVPNPTLNDVPDLLLEVVKDIDVYVVVEDRNLETHTMIWWQNRLRQIRELVECHTRSGAES